MKYIEVTSGDLYAHLPQRHIIAIDSISYFSDTGVMEQFAGTFIVLKLGNTIKVKETFAQVKKMIDEANEVRTQV
jgi:hypothetical protein